MIKYKVQKASPRDSVRYQWMVVRVRGLERVVQSRWVTHGTALEAALEYAGLANPLPQESTC